LREICRAMLPLISCDPNEARQRLTAAYDEANKQMEKQDQDAVVQKAARDFVDHLTREIVAAAAARGSKP
jgi:hypothetical protein